MKKFLAIFIGTESAVEKSGWSAMSEEERRGLQESGMKAWGEWVAANEQSIVDHGSPLGKTRRVSAQGISDTANAMAAYVVVQADSHEAAARLFESHPHFTIFPGEAVEVMECLPVPGM